MTRNIIVAVFTATVVVLLVRVQPSVEARTQVEAALAFVRAEVEAVHARRDAEGFGALHTESTVFEWQGRATPLVGRVDLVASRRKVWAPRQNLRLVVRVSEMRIHGDRAYEFGSYEESWTDPQNRNVIELGRYVTSYVLERDRRWRIARTFGFTDSTSTK